MRQEFVPPTGPSTVTNQTVETVSESLTSEEILALLSPTQLANLQKKAERQAEEAEKVRLRTERRAERAAEEAEKVRLREERRAERAAEEAEKARLREERESIRQFEFQTLMSENEKNRALSKEIVPNLDVLEFPKFRGTQSPNYYCPVQSEDNYRLFIENCPAIRDQVFYDEFLATIFVNGQPFSSDRIHVDEIYSEIAGKIFRPAVRQELWSRAFRKFIDAHRINCVQEHIKSLRWDRIPRIETSFIEHNAIEDTPLNREKTKLVFQSLVKRIFEPGCQCDNFFVVTGPQGSGKSTFWRFLAAACVRPYMDAGLTGICEINTSIMADEKRTIEKTAGCVIANYDEMPNFDKADSATTKAFVSRTCDKSRLAYRTDSTTKERQFITVATTNNTTMLRDDQLFERRYIIFEIDKTQCSPEKNRDRVRWNNDHPEYFDQLIAEAYAKYLAEPDAPICLSVEAEKLFAEEQVKYKAFNENSDFEAILDRMESNYCVPGDRITTDIEFTKTEDFLKENEICSNIAPHQVNIIRGFVLSNWMRKNGIYKKAKVLEQFLRGKWEYKKVHSRTTGLNTHCWVRVGSDLNQNETELF